MGECVNQLPPRNKLPVIQYPGYRTFSARVPSSPDPWALVRRGSGLPRRELPHGVDDALIHFIGQRRIARDLTVQACNGHGRHQIVIGR
jgi:hypothetical protein